MFPLHSAADPYGTLPEYVDVRVFLPASLEKKLGIKRWKKKLKLNDYACAQ